MSASILEPEEKLRISTTMLVHYVLEGHEKRGLTNEVIRAIRTLRQNGDGVEIGKALAFIAFLEVEAKKVQPNFVWPPDERPVFT